MTGCHEKKLYEMKYICKYIGVGYKNKEMAFPIH